MKGNFSEILKKHCLKCRYAHNFRKISSKLRIFYRWNFTTKFSKFYKHVKSKKLKKKFYEHPSPQSLYLPLSHYHITGTLPITLSTTMVTWVSVTGKHLVPSIFKNFLIEINRTQKTRSDRKSSVKNRWSINWFFNLEFLETSKSLLVALSHDKMAQ